jgi:hypothetical protein
VELHVVNRRWNLQLARGRKREGWREGERERRRKKKQKRENKRKKQRKSDEKMGRTQKETIIRN